MTSSTASLASPDGTRQVTCASLRAVHRSWALHLGRNARLYTGLLIPRQLPLSPMMVFPIRIELALDVPVRRTKAEIAGHGCRAKDSGWTPGEAAKRAVG
jgi:hypothetical protein